MSGKNHTPLSLADLEQIVADATLGKDALSKIDSPVSIHVCSVRKRLADADGISFKASLDGLVLAGLLPDDDPKHVKEVTFSQRQGQPEHTEITIEVAEG